MVAEYPGYGINCKIRKPVSKYKSHEMADCPSGRALNASSQQISQDAENIYHFFLN